MRFLAIIVAVLLYWPIPSCGQQQQPPQGVSAGNQNSSTNHQNLTAAPAVVKQADAIEDYAAEEAKAALSQATANWWVVRFTGALLFVGFIQATIYAIQCWMMKKTVEQSRKSSERGLRAYISINSQNISDSQAQDSKAALPEAFLLYIENTGQTPASNVVCASTWEHFPGHEAKWPTNVPHKTFEEIQNADNRVGSRTSLGAGLVHCYRLALLPHKDGTKFADAIERAAQEDITVYIYGEITYDDIFKNESRFTQFSIRTITNSHGIVSFGGSGQHHDAN